MNSDADLKRYVSKWLTNAIRNANAVDDFLDAQARMFRAVETAVAEVANTWNTRASPTIYKLPPELLAVGFTYLELPDRFSICRVCRHWNAVLISHPQLWTNYYIKIKEEHQIAILGKWLNRSGWLPLDLKLALKSAELLSPMLELVKEFSGRIRRLALRPSLGFFPASATLSFRGFYLPLLESLRVTCSVECLPHAPLLRRLEVECLALNKIDFNYAHLVDFSGRLLGSEAVNFFQLCPNLVRVSLSIAIGSRFVCPRGPAPSSLSHLVLLSYYGQWGSVDDVLENFKGCKILRDIRLDGEGFSTTAALNFFNSLGPPPERLSITDSGLMLCDRNAITPRSVSLTHHFHRDHLARILEQIDMSSIREIDMEFYMLYTPQLLTVPVLTHLRLLIRGELVLYDDISIVMDALATRFIAPELHTLTISSNRTAHFDALPNVFKKLGIPRLQALVFTNLTWNLDFDLSRLRLCTDHVYQDERELSLGDDPTDAT